MASFLELEELVGRCWHRWVSAAGSYPRYPQAGVDLAEIRGRLAVFFRGLGGAGGVRLAPAAASGSAHRLKLRQRLGFGGEEPVEQACLDAESLTLPASLDVFPERSLNEKLYFWLAAFFAHVDAGVAIPEDPLQRDLHRLRMSHAATRKVLHAWPGLQAWFDRLCEGLVAARPARPLKGWEAAVEEVVMHLLGSRERMEEPGAYLLSLVCDPARPLDQLSAGRGYRPFLPVPLWGEVAERAAGTVQEGDESGGGGGQEAHERRLRAERRASDETRREDSLLLNRFESILALAQMLNINREVEDDDPEGARQAADSVDEMALGRHRRRPGTRLKLDLELAPPAVDAHPLRRERTYPEWDYKRQGYHQDHCCVVAEAADQEGIDWTPDAATHRRIRKVRRQFEALRPGRQTFASQPDGEDLDLSALVRSYVDLQANGAGSDRVYLHTRRAARDLSVAVLADASLSTDSWVDNRRVLDVEKEAVLALGHGLDACGDDHGIFTFSSRTRHQVNVRTIKDFDEPLGHAAMSRLQALTPGYYTRIGAALRHVSARLRERPHRHRLLLLLTDGKPNDVDHYEGRYGVEDTRRAIREVRNSGVSVFGITVDSKARDYFPYLFGRGGYAIVARISRLPAALPAIVRQVTT